MTVAQARRVAMYLLREDAGLMATQVAQELSRDHSTVLHGHARIHASVYLLYRYLPIRRSHDRATACVYAQRPTLQLYYNPASDTVPLASLSPSTWCGANRRPSRSPYHVA